MTPTAFPRTRKTRAVRSLILYLVVGGTFFWALNSTLTQMTQNDCQMGIQQACKVLQK